MDAKVSPPVTEDAEIIAEIVREISHSHRRGDALLLATAMLGKPDPSDATVKSMKKSHVLRSIENYGLLEKGSRFGWVRPDGQMLCCAYAAHDRLLHWLGMTAHEAETAGWARVGERVQCLVKMTSAQIRRIEALGHQVDREKNAEMPAIYVGPRIPTPG